LRSVHRVTQRARSDVASHRVCSFRSLVPDSGLNVSGSTNDCIYLLGTLSGELRTSAPVCGSVLDAPRSTCVPPMLRNASAQVKAKHNYGSKREWRAAETKLQQVRLNSNDVVGRYNVEHDSFVSNKPCDGWSIVRNQHWCNVTRSAIALAYMRFPGHHMCPRFGRLCDMMPVTTSNLQRYGNCFFAGTVLPFHYSRGTCPSSCRVG
jgi:hypothetical protein